MKRRYGMMGMGLVVGMMAAGALAQGTHQVIIKDDGSASEESEGTVVIDTFGKSSPAGQQRGRYENKIYVGNTYGEDSGNYVGAIKVMDIVNLIGQNQKIVKAKLEVEVTNAANDKGGAPEVVAYPFIEDWNYAGFKWQERLAGTKWNAAGNINLTPAPDVSGDKTVYDFADAAGGVKLAAKGVRYGTAESKLRQGENAEFDITEMVKGWYSGSLPNCGLALIAPNPGTYVRFSASNGDAFEPKVIVTCEGEGPTTIPGGSGPGAATGSMMAPPADLSAPAAPVDLSAPPADMSAPPAPEAVPAPPAAVPEAPAVVPEAPAPAPAAPEVKPEPAKPAPVAIPVL